MMHRLFRILAALALLLSSPVFAQDAEQAERLEARAADIVAAMRGEAIYDNVFADGFVAAVPEAQFIAIRGQIEGQFGALIGVQSVEPVSPNGAQIAIRFERGLASGSFALETSAPYAVTGFVLNDMRPIGDSAAQVLADLAALPGETSMLVTRIGVSEPLIASNAEVQFAIGSTFKLYVLSALAHSIAAGERDWNDVVPLTARSYPSGQLQDWPQGSPLTLYTLATLMISTSDNTATDQLIAVLGRDAVEAEVIASGHSNPAATLPFLTTRELFVLKSGIDTDPGEYLGMDLMQRREALEFLAGIERDEEEVRLAFTGGPNMIDIEWFASGEDIARAFQRIAALEDNTALEILAVNPSMSQAMRGEWTYVGYKGGSEPGVLNLSWLLRDDAGEWVVVSMSWNNPQAV
ncbi:MAG: serine hydrolase, partial [Erythrobacter sp.]|nr:serine hydrolase [Erythrobacter sp.]